MAIWIWIVITTRMRTDHSLYSNSATEVCKKGWWREKGSTGRWARPSSSTSKPEWRRFCGCDRLSSSSTREAWCSTFLSGLVSSVGTACPNCWAVVVWWSWWNWWNSLLVWREVCSSFWRALAWETGSSVVCRWFSPLLTFSDFSVFPFDSNLCWCTRPDTKTGPSRVLSRCLWAFVLSKCTVVGLGSLVVLVLFSLVSKASTRGSRKPRRSCITCNYAAPPIMDAMQPIITAAPIAPAPFAATCASADVARFAEHCFFGYF